jgi:hypothetical protein
MLRRDIRRSSTRTAPVGARVWSRVGARCLARSSGTQSAVAIGRSRAPVQPPDYDGTSGSMVNAEAFELDEEEPARRVLVFDGSSVVESADCVPPRSCWSSQAATWSRTTMAAARAGEAGARSLPSARCRALVGMTSGVAVGGEEASCVVDFACARGSGSGRSASERARIPSERPLGGRGAACVSHGPGIGASGGRAPCGRGTPGRTCARGRAPRGRSRTGR